MKKIFHPRIEDINIEQVFYALSDSTRLIIFKRLYEANKELVCNHFDDLGKKSNLSNHYKVLRENGIINVRQEGRYRFLTLRVEDLDKRFPNLLKSTFEIIS